MSKIDTHIKQRNKLDVETAEVDEEGMLTNGTTALQGDLLPGETIVGQYHCETAPKPLSCCYIAFWTVVTLGLYLIWRFCCRCCRAVTWKGNKQKLAITFLGRLIVWETAQQGEQAARCSTRCCMCFPCVCICKDLCAPDSSYEVSTRLFFAHARDVAAMNHEHERGAVDIFRPRVRFSTGLKYTLGTAGLWLFYRLFLVIFRLCMLCCGCDKHAFSSKLTLYLREWPSRDLEEFDANFIPLVRSETSDMVNLKEGLGHAWLLSKFAQIIKGSAYVLERTCAMEFWSSFSRPLELPFIRVGAMRDARYMKDDGTPLSSEEAFTSLLNLQKYILEYKLGNMAPTLVRKPKAEWANPFSIKASDCHVRDPGSWGMGDAGTMQLGTETVALLPDENVVNVLPMVPVWAMSDCILTIMTLGLYYCFTVSKKRKTCHAVVLTDKRVIDVHICSGAAKRTDALMGGWQQAVKTYFFMDPITGGFISRKKKAIKVAVSTRAQHSLVFDFKTASNACMCNKKSAGGNDPETAIHFAYTLTLHQTTTKPLELGPSYKTEISPALASRLPLEGPNETVLYHLEDDDKNQRCSQAVSNCCLKTWTCGLRPIDDHVELILTSHRAYFLRTLTNKPCVCLLSMKKKDEFYLGWVDHAEVTGYSLEANVKGFDTCCRRFLASVLPCCYALFDSSLALHVSIGNTSSAVYFLQTQRGGDDFGLMQSKPVARLRALLSALEMSRVARDIPFAQVALVSSPNPELLSFQKVPAAASNEEVAKMV